MLPKTDIRLNRIGRVRQSKACHCGKLLPRFFSWCSARLLRIIEFDVNLKNVKHLRNRRVHSEFCQTSKKDLFAKKGNTFQSLTIFSKNSIVYVDDTGCQQLKVQ